MQDTKAHPRTGLFRFLLLLGLFAVLLAAMVPGAQAAETQADSVRRVIPLGRAVGIKLFSDGVLVVGLSDLTTDQGTASPAKACGLQKGDVITHINGTQVDSIEDVQGILQQLEGAEMSLTVVRNEESRQVTAKAVPCSTGGYKLGAWIRDSLAGIGTLTFADPATGLFATLGHGISDGDTAVLMRLQSGAITPASVAGVVKGTDGRPGELRGTFSSDRDLGALFANTTCGVFGQVTDRSLLSGPTVEVAASEEVHTGPVTILSNVAGTEVQEYTAEILKVYSDPADTRDLLLKVTDQRLLSRTGGIVQGMSGSPILQDGKLVGAVTHVLIDHADRGYGILAQRMLEEAEAAAEDA